MQWNSYEKTPLFTPFQATTASEHDVKKQGLHYLVKLAENCKFEALAIRFIAVMPASAEVKIKTPVKWHKKLAVHAVHLLNCDPKV